ncbi:MAG: phosphodiester glycosidase family protein [Actinobacteria bacterium]|nr:phosphodiester glycosidase family protein [Actinomycetota bacterium]
MLFRLAFAALTAGAFALAAGATPEQATELMPAVTFQKQIEFTPQGPVVVDVITGPRPGGLYSLEPVVAGTISNGLEPVTQLEQDVSASATAAGVNGDSFTTKGYPTGIILQNGVLLHGAYPTRASIGVDASGLLRVKQVTFVGTWKGAGQRRPLAGVNQVPQSGQVVLFTPAWGAATPLVANASEVVLEPFPAATPGSDLQAPVTATNTGGGTQIPADGAVLMSVGAATGGLPSLQDDAPEGTNVTVRLILPSDWGNVVNAIGGGPALVTNGRPVFHTSESFDPGSLAERTARAAVGQLSDGRILLVAVDGGQPGYSTGISIYDLARTMVQLGAVTAAALDSGSNVTAAFNGQLLSRPSAVAGRPVKDALLFEYTGVYAPPPSLPVLTKNDAPAGEQLAYKVVRASNVTASVLSPSGQVFTVDSGDRQPGTYTFPFATFDAEGTYHWNVKATDDQTQQVSVADQPFQYDLTLSAVRAPKSASARNGLNVSFQLSRAASVTLQIETLTGAVVRVLPAVQLQPGPQSLHWDGTLTDGVTKAVPGTYVARLVTTSAVGTSNATTQFTLRS